MGPVLADLAAIRAELADFHSEMTDKLTELSQAADASGQTTHPTCEEA